MRNARQSPRLRRRWKIAIAEALAFTVDVSIGGFCVELMRVLTPGTMVEGSIRHGEREMPFTGRVAWARAGDARMHLRGRIGVQFVRMPPELPQLLAR